MKSPTSPQPISVQFDTHLPHLLRELVEGNPCGGPLACAVNLTIPILRQLAERASELNDPALNILMLRLALYEVEPSKRIETIEAERMRLSQPPK